MVKVWTNGKAVRHYQGQDRLHPKKDWYVAEVVHLSDVKDVLYELYDEVQELRENGEGDLRSVLHHIDRAVKKVNNLG